MTNGQARSPRALLTSLLVIALAANVAGGCAVVESQTIAFEAPPPGISPCVSPLGSYALPKAFVHVSVGSDDSLTTPFSEIVRHPDPSLVFCLDHLASVFAAEKIEIRKALLTVPATASDAAKTVTTPFLGAVMVNSTDKTSEIISGFLQAASILVTGNPDFVNRSTTIQGGTLADLEFDPFDPLETAAANARMTQLGWCVVLDGFSFDKSRFNVQQYCAAPERIAARPTMVVKAYVKAEAQRVDPLYPGLLYRPRNAYRLLSYRKKDPGGRGRWQLTNTSLLEMENLSPVLSLDVSRSVFATRQANFVFEQGTLITACVFKTSELLGASEVPLHIARAIIDIPGAMMTVRIDQFKGQANLVQAQKALYQVQQSYLKASTTGTFSPVSDTSTQPAAGLPDLTKGLPKASDNVVDPVDFGKDLFEADLAGLCAGTS